MARCKIRADLLIENRGRAREIFNEAIATLDAGQNCKTLRPFERKYFECRFAEVHFMYDFVSK